MKKRADNIARFNAVTIAPAQSIKLLQPGTCREAILSILQTKIFTNPLLSPLFKYLVLIMFQSGCRISEVIRLRKSDISPSFLIHIRASKGSNNQIIQVQPLTDFGLDYNSLPEDLFCNFSRHYVYRQLKQFGIYEQFEAHRNNSVTHLFRHLLAKESMNYFKDRAATSKNLGHKNPDNLKYYE